MTREEILGKHLGNYYVPPVTKVNILNAMKEVELTYFEREEENKAAIQELALKIDNAIPSGDCYDWIIVRDLWEKLYKLLNNEEKI